jgi:PAS domain-containing protein/DNA-binding CsgD family transcriptional regulator
VYHRDHGAPVESSSLPSLVDESVSGQAQVTVRHVPEKPSPDGGPSSDALLPDAAAGSAHACLWNGIVDVDQGFVLLLNGDHVCVFASEGVRDTFGCPPETLIGIRPESHLPGDQLPQVWRTRAAVSSGARHVLTRVRWRAGDGQDRWFDASSTLVGDPATGAEYTAVHCRDVTHEMELQAALSRSEQRHARLLESVDHAVLQLDAALRIVSFNLQALALLGRAPDQLLGRGGFAAVDLRDEDGRAISDPAHPCLADGTGAGRDGTWCTVLCADGQRTLVLARLASFSGARPEDGGHLLILRTSGRFGSGPTVPSREQARGAAGLTAREGDVLDGLAAGGDVPTVARWLGISVHSVRGHVKSITGKLGVHSQLQAVIAATRRGMVDLSEEPRMPPAAPAAGGTAGDGVGGGLGGGGALGDSGGAGGSGTFGGGAAEP